MPLKCSNCGFFINADSGGPYTCPKCKKTGTIQRIESININKNKFKIEAIQCQKCKGITIFYFDASNPDYFQEQLNCPYCDEDDVNKKIKNKAILEDIKSMIEKL